MKPLVSIVPTRERVTIEKRKPLTRAQALELAINQAGRCGCLKCGLKLRPLVEGVVDEHIIPLTLGGSNAIENRSLWRKPCSAAKTHGKSGDLSRGFKAKRQAGERKPRVKRPIRSNPKINSRPFATRRKAGTEARIR